MIQTVSLKDMRDQLSELVARVAYGNRKVVITKFGKPLAALVTFEDYEKMMDPRKKFTQAELEKGFEFIDKSQEATKNISQKVFQKAITKAIKEVRSAKSTPNRS